MTLSMRKEIRFGCPEADKIIFNRYYTLGYSYYFRQARWALEIVKPNIPNSQDDQDRIGNFRADFRISEPFRVDETDYRNSGYNRGHLVSSANQIERAVQNSETFLMSNMIPQNGSMNSGIWKNLEDSIRILNEKPKVLETFSITGPIFSFDEITKQIGKVGKRIPIPSHLFKCVLTDNTNKISKGGLGMWAFIIPNSESVRGHNYNKYAVSTYEVEKKTGMVIWPELIGAEVAKLKNPSKLPTL